jgi:flagellar motility protein MotE (MotC chaperone)
VNRKVILITVVAGVVGFAGAFGAGWLTKPRAAASAATPPQGSPAAQSQARAGSPPQVLTPSSASPNPDANARAMTEQQLKELINDVREKSQQYDEKLKAIEKEKERLQITQQVLKKDVESLNNLRVDLAATVANIKTQRDLLLKTRTEVEQTEKANLMAIAQAYDKMDAASASSILTSMATGQSKGSGVRTSNIDDAVKILHFMQDRTKAKVLAEMATAEPALAATLCQKLKQVTETR